MVGLNIRISDALEQHVYSHHETIKYTEDTWNNIDVTRQAQLNICTAVVKITDCNNSIVNIPAFLYNFTGGDPATIWMNMQWRC